MKNDEPKLGGYFSFPSTPKNLKFNEDDLANALQGSIDNHKGVVRKISSLFSEFGQLELELEKKQDPLKNLNEDDHLIYAFIQRILDIFGQIQEYLALNDLSPSPDKPLPFIAEIKELLSKFTPTEIDHLSFENIINRFHSRDLDYEAFMTFIKTYKSIVENTFADIVQKSVSQVK